MSGRRKKVSVNGTGLGREPGWEARAASYIRVSTPGQEDNYSLAFQREHIRALAERLGFVIAPRHEYQDVRTSADPDRAGYLALQDAVAAGEVSAVLAYDDSRLERDPFRLLYFVRKCMEKGVTVHFADGTKVETKMDELIQYVKGFASSDERDKIMKRTMDGKRSAAENGKMPNGMGAGLYGLRFDEVFREWGIYEVEAAVVRMVFQWRLEGASFSQIARWLNQRGIRSKTGLDWSPGTVRTMVRNERYTGEGWFGTHRHEKVYGNEGGAQRKVTERPREEWIRLEGATPRIIEPEVWKKAQEVRVRAERKGVAWDYHLTEFFHCGVCGGLIAGATQTADGKKRRFSYTYYRCQCTLGDFRRPKVCNLKMIPAEALEMAVDAAVRDAVRDPEGVFAEMRANMGDGDGARERRIASLDKQIRDNERQVEKLSMEMAGGRVLERVYKKMVAPMILGIERLEDERALLAAEIREDMEFDRFEEDMRAVFSRYSANLDSLDKKGMANLMRMLGVRLTAMPEGVLVTGVLDSSLLTIGQTSA